MQKPPLFGFQKEGLEFGLTRDRLIYRIPPGGGKTRLACEVARNRAETSMLWLSPVTAVPHIVRQIQQWGAPYWRVAGVRDRVPPADVLVVPYSQLVRPVVFDELMRRTFDRIVIDEAHYIKNLRTLRTRAVYGEKGLYKSGGLIDTARRAIVMSGTLAPNGNPLEIYPHLRAIFPRTIMTDKGLVMGEDRFARNFTFGEPSSQGWKVRGTRNIHELKRRLEPVLFNVPQSVLDRELPAFNMDFWPVEEAQLPEELLALERLDTIQAVAEFVRQHGKLPPVAYDQHLSTLLKLIGLAKVPIVVYEALSFLQQSERKLVLFVKHLDVLDQLVSAFREYNALSVSGSTPPKERERRIQDFTHSPEVRVIVLQMHAAGTGFDLVASQDAWFVDLDWNPSTLLQAAKRLHRPGQKHPVFCRMYTLRGTMDDAVEGVIARKTASIREAFSD